MRVAPPMPRRPELRIPPGARPLRYDVKLTVAPGEADVAGEAAIDIELDRPHPILWLNAVGLSIGDVGVDVTGTNVRVAANRDQFLGLAFDPPLPAGRHRVTLVYAAPQNRNSSRGIFTLQDGDAWYTMTHFEPMAARQAFPCFDEPGFKVPWQLTLRVPRAMVAVSNTPVVSETAVDETDKIVRFAQTEPLPSYLVAFAVGPWDVVSAGTLGRRPTPMRLIAARGHASSLAFASHAFPELFTLEERWFGIDYPFAKLDHIAIPLAVRFAMENAGLITVWSDDPAAARCCDACVPPRRCESRRARDGAPVVREPGDDGVVGRHLAQRGVCDVVRGKDGRCVAARLRAWRAARARAGRSHRSGSARIRPSHPRANPRAWRHLQRIRFDHVPEGRNGHRHVRGVGGR
jgi:hypothetical protein